MRRGVFFLILICISPLALSQEDSRSITLKASSFYLGAGIGFNTATGGNGTGGQIIGGYLFDFKLNRNISTAIELGYMNSGNFDTKFFSNDATLRTNDKAKGVWLNVVETVPIGNRVEALVRLGFDFGDDDGLMAGTGLGYYFNTNWSLRSEYVVRDTINSFQFNLLYNF